MVQIPSRWQNNLELLSKPYRRFLSSFSLMKRRQICPVTFSAHQQKPFLSNTTFFVCLLLFPLSGFYWKQILALFIPFNFFFSPQLFLFSFVNVESFRSYPIQHSRYSYSRLPSFPLFFWPLLNPATYFWPVITVWQGVVRDQKIILDVFDEQPFSQTNLKRKFILDEKFKGFDIEIVMALLSLISFAI